MYRPRLLAAALALLTLSTPNLALAWGSEGHQIVAAIARSFLTPTVKAKVEALLANDQGNDLTAHDMLSEANWADAWRGAGHKETASWHFVDIELDHPDLRQACFGFPSPGPTASQGPAQDCIVDKVNAFRAELASPSTLPEERLVALKYLLHFVGDLTQPLHAADNHDRGGNCVQLALGGSRTVNLHSYWDTAVVQALGSDPVEVATRLTSALTPQDRAAAERGDVGSWAMQSYALAKVAVYTVGSKPGCDDQSPLTPPAGYDATAQKAAALQLQRAGVRLAMILNSALR